MSDSILEVRKEGRVGIMTFNRPEVLNAFNPEGTVKLRLVGLRSRRERDNRMA